MSSYVNVITYTNNNNPDTALIEEQVYQIKETATYIGVKFKRNQGHIPEVKAAILRLKKLIQQFDVDTEVTTEDPEELSAAIDTLRQEGVDMGEWYSKHATVTFCNGLLEGLGAESVNFRGGTLRIVDSHTP